MKAKQWQMQEAKAKLSEVIQKACEEGPQEISVRGKIKAVMISKERYKYLTSPKSSFIKLLQESPLFGLEIDLEREKSLCREIEL